jgi:two-component system, LytTR family, sensor kinase
MRAGACIGVRVMMRDAKDRDPAPPWRLSRTELVLIFLFWTSIAALSVLNSVLDPRGYRLRIISPVGSFVLPFLEAWLWALLTPVVFWLSSRFSLERSKLVTRLPVLLLAGLAIAVSVDLVLDFIRFEFFPGPRRRPATFMPFRTLGRLGFLSELLVYFAVLAAGFAREYFRRSQQREVETGQLEARAALLEAQLSRARLETLRMQINPHFLFNTLHAISALVERDAAGVRRMIARLSEMLRHTMESRGSEEVPLRDEMALLDRYLEIMEVRFQGRLRIEREVEPAVLDCLVPNLILQPIVENAFEHGVSRIRGPGRVRIEARREGEMLLMAVHDNGPGFDDGAERAGGVGIRNTRERLRELYGEADGLRLSTEAGGGGLAEMRLPFRTAGDPIAEGGGEIEEGADE